MGKYKLINNALGWIVFAIASTVYLMTMEPTASFWDCGEFISSAYKLEVGHPPGAPFFMLTANLFTQLASDPATVAKMVNTMSALFSGLTILFLFWSITHLARKIMVKDGEEASLGQMITIMGSGLVGALAYTFSDTFWFSAVEGEVYAYSSLFTAVVFWLILKWEAVADKPHADRWIVLIAYLMGLSIGVHLLNLLCIPAIVLVYYYKKFPNPTMKGTLVALLVSFAIIALMMYGVVQGLLFRTVVCQHIRYALQFRSICLCDHCGRRIDLVYLGNHARRDPSDTYENCIHPVDRIDRYSVYRQRLRVGGHSDCSFEPVPVQEPKGEYQDTEYGLSLPDGCRCGLFFVCTDADPCNGRHADEPERAERYLYAAYLSGT